MGRGAGRAHPTIPARSRAAGGAPGAAPALSIGHLPGNESVLVWDEGGTRGWTGQGCEELETCIAGAGTGSPRGMKWCHGLWAA